MASAKSGGSSGPSMATATPQLVTGLPGNRICGNHIAFCGAVRSNLDPAQRLASSLSCGFEASGGGRTPLIGTDSIGVVAFLAWVPQPAWLPPFFTAGHVARHPSASDDTTASRSYPTA